MVDALFIVSIFLVAIALFSLLTAPCLLLYCLKNRPVPLPTAASLVFASLECCCCMDAQVNTQFPCGHRCLCLRCAQMVNTCPLCRQPVGRVVGLR